MDCKLCKKVYMAKLEVKLFLTSHTNSWINSKYLSEAVSAVDASESMFYDLRKLHQFQEFSVHFYSSFIRFIFLVESKVNLIWNESGFYLLEKYQIG